MTQIINHKGGFTERVTVNRIEALPGHFHVKVETQFSNSRNPEMWRTLYQTTCEQGGLESLGREIYEAVVSELN